MRNNAELERGERGLGEQDISLIKETTDSYSEFGIPNSEFNSGAHFEFLGFAGGFLLVLASAFCTMGALISAFSFPVDMRTLFLVLFIASLLSSALASVFRGKGLLALIPPVLVVFLLRYSEIIDGAMWVIRFITGEYNVWIAVPVLFPGAVESAFAVSLFFAVAGAAYSVLLSSAICLRRSTPFTAILTIPPVMLTFVVLDFEPNLWYLVGLLAVYVTMLVCGSMYPDSYKKRGRAVFPALALAMLLMSAAYIAAPPDSYRRVDIISAANDRIRDIAQRFGIEMKSGPGLRWPIVVSDFWQFNIDFVNVSGAGARGILDKELLEVTSTESGIFYLRGYSMQRFDGNIWVDNSDVIGAHYGITTPEVTPATLMSIYGWYNPNYEAKLVNMTVNKTGDSTDIAYMPYHTYRIPIGIWGDDTDSGLVVVRNNNANSYFVPYRTLSMPIGLGSLYSVEFYHPEADVFSMAEEIPEEAMWYVPREVYTGYVASQYLHIDAVTAIGLKEIAEEAGITADADRAVIADKVAGFISSSAQYTLSPRPIPYDEDFTLYFLQTAKRGYCIHFATAATLMLRTLGVPARFTSGFLAVIPPDEVGRTVALTDRHAHAWVEVFYDDIGWLPLEVTPASQMTGIPGASGQAPLITEQEDDRWYDDFDEWAILQEMGGETSVTQETGAGTGAGSEAQQQQRQFGYRYLITGGTLVFICAALFLRRHLAGKKREKALSQPNTNAAVISAWKYVFRLKPKTNPPAEIEELALKARFSRHIISEDERGTVINYAKSVSENMNRYLNPLGRFWLRYIRGL